MKKMEHEKFLVEIEKARFKEYKLGEHDCALFAINTIKEVYGIDYGEKIRGHYNSRIGYFRIWRSLGCWSMKEVTNKITGLKSERMRRVRKGDLVLFKDEEMKEHLGMCLGDKVAIVTLSDRLAFVDILKCECCWRIGELSNGS